MNLVRTLIQEIYETLKNMFVLSKNSGEILDVVNKDGINETKSRRRIQILEHINHEDDEKDEEEVNEDDEEECNMACRDFLEYVTYQIYYNAFTDEA